MNGFENQDYIDEKEIKLETENEARKRFDDFLFLKKSFKIIESCFMYPKNPKIGDKFGHIKFTNSSDVFNQEFFIKDRKWTLYLPEIKRDFMDFFSAHFNDIKIQPMTQIPLSSKSIFMAEWPVSIKYYCYLESKKEYDEIPVVDTYEKVKKTEEIK